MNRDHDYWLDKPGNVRLLTRLLSGICAGLLLGDLLVYRHVDHPWEAWWGFYGFFGFIACVSLVLIARQLRRLVGRREDYYRREPTDE